MQRLWNNSLIRIDPKPVYFREWLAKGILTVESLIKYETCFPSYTEFLNKYHCKSCPLAFSGIISTVADFLHERSQRVKLGSDCFSEFTPVPAGIPQGTCIGPWLFLFMINDLTTTDNSLSAMWKFADDTTVSEIVPKFGASNLQAIVDHVLNWSNANNFQLNSLKCKELRIDFRRKANVGIPALEVNTNTFEAVKSGTRRYTKK